MKYKIFTFFSLLTCLQWFTCNAQPPKLVIPAGNTGRIDHLDFSPDGKYLMSTFGSDKVILWDLAGKEVFNEYKLPGRITDALFCPQGDMIAASSTDGSLGFWKYQGKDFSSVTRELPVINSMAFTPGGDSLITCNTDTTLKIFDWHTNKVLFNLNTGDPLDQVTVSHNGKYAAFGDRLGKIYFFNIQTGEKEFFNKVCDGAIHQLCFDSRDSLLATADSKGMIYLINLQPFKIIYSIKAFTSQAFSISFFRNYIIATGRDNKLDLKFFRIADGKEENVFPAYKENINAPDFIYGIYCHTVFRDGILAVANPDQTISCWNFNSKREDITLQGSSAGINDIDVDNDGLIYFASDNKAGVFDLKGNKIKSDLMTTKYPVEQICHSRALVAALGSDTSIYLINTENLKINSYRVNAEAFAAPLRLIDDRELIYRVSPSGLIVRDIKSGKSKNLKIPDCYDYKISSTGNRMVAYSNKNEIQVWDRIKWKRIEKIPAADLSAFDINESGDVLAGVYQEGNQQVIRVLQLDNQKEKVKIAVPDSIHIDRVYLCNHASTLLSISRSSAKFNRGEDYSIRIWDLEKGEYSGKFSGHTSLISDVSVFNNNTIISASIDGTLRLWSLINDKELATLVPFRNGEWVVLNELGMFDASPMAMEKLHFVFDNQEIDLNQLKSNFYEPKLLQKILGYSEEAYSIHPTEKQYSLYPEIRLVPPEFNDGVLTASFRDQGGGIGKISVLINGKEAIEDARDLHNYDSASNSFNYTITGHPYIKPGALNKITVRVFNNKGYKISNEKSIYLLSDMKGSASGSPDLYAIIIGISDYQGSDIDLTFAAKDAEDFARAIQIGASKYLGADHVFIHRLTTLEKDSTQWPYKKNIETAFSEVASKAQPRDILLVYISGHGMDNADDNEFYFLTAGAGSKTIHDPVILPKVTISSTSLVKLVKQVPALKELMIIDACHSGNIVSGLTNPNELNSGSIRALESVKDRTGMYILASSEGEQVSYESSLFNQGLLTYSLLFGLKGAGLRDGEMADVVDLLQFVDGNVPVLAGDIGKEQMPVIKIPDDVSSFSIGKMTPSEKEKIDIKSPKPIVARSSFQNEMTFADNLQLSQLVDEQIKEERDLLKNKFIFLDENSFNNAIQVYGRYRMGKSSISVNYKVFKNDVLLKQDNITSDTPANLAKAIAENLVSVINQRQ